MPRILLADDDQGVRDLTGIIMREAGFTVELAVNGVEALGKARNQRPDIIVSDVLMPEMDGFMLCREIKNDPALRRIPFILYTSSAIAETEESLALKLGAARFVSKGAKFLLEVVRDELSRLDAPPSGPAAATSSTWLPELGQEYIRVLSDKLYAKEQELSEALNTLRERDALLQRAQKLDSIGRFSGGVAHDLNNLIGPVLGYADLLRKSLPDCDPRHADLNEITRAAERAAELTRHLLALSRRQVLDIRTTNLNSIVSGIGGLLQRLIGEHIQVRYALHPNGALVKVDAGKIEHAIINLAVNARDAMPKGGTLTISTSRAEIREARANGELLPPGRYAVLSISDTGCGMDKATLGRIFEPFFTTKPAGKGTGLGLSLVYGIVKQSGGDIRAESRPGEGAVFRIYLPLLCEGDCASMAGPVTPAGTELTLIVEDDDAMRGRVRRILTGAGLAVIEAKDGQEAVLLFEKNLHAVRVIVTDLVLPGMDGIALAKEILQHDSRIGILFMSGYMDKETELRRALGLQVAYLQKPFPPDALLKKIRKLRAGN